MTIDSWLFKRNNLKERLNPCLENGIMTLGWPGVVVATEHFRTQHIIRQEVRNKYAYLKNNRAAGCVAGHFRRFLGEAKKGDYIVMPMPGELYIAKITGEPIIDSEHKYEDCSYYRAVKWLNGGKSIEKKGNINQLLWGKATNRSASCYLAGCTEHIESILEGNSNADRVHQELIRNLHECLQGSIQATELEKWVGVLFEKMGACVKMTGGSNERGADVMATFSASDAGQLSDQLERLREMFGISADGMADDGEEFTIACQVKQHRGKENHGAMQQLIRGLEQRIADDEKIHAALLITTADSISVEIENDLHQWNEKQEERDETCNIQIWQGMMLAENILRAHGMIDFVNRALPTQSK